MHLFYAAHITDGLLLTHVVRNLKLHEESIPGPPRATSPRANRVQQLCDHEFLLRDLGLSDLPVEERLVPLFDDRLELLRQVIVFCV